MTKQVVYAAAIVSLAMSTPEAAQTMESAGLRENAVLRWNDIVMRTVIGQNGVEQVRTAAIAHLAIFEVVNAIAGGFTPYLETTVPSPDASVEAAVAVAAHDVLVRYVPDRKDQLQLERERALKPIPDGAPKRLGMALGADVAAAMIRHRDNDGSEHPELYVPETQDPGAWQLTPSCRDGGGLFLHWSRLKPFGLRRGNQFRGDAPPRLTGRRFARDYNAIETVGGADSNARPKDRAEVALFFAAVQSQHVWNPIAAQVAKARRLSISDSARLFALLNMAMNDALVAVMDAKYHYTFWRPETAIRAGDTDGNPETEPNTAFTPFIEAPCHPSYPSAHASSSYAARAVLERLLGDGRHVVTLSTPSLPEITLRYTRLVQVTRDIDDARIYGGIHYRFDQQAGARQGQRVGEYIVAYNLRRVRTHRARRPH